MNIVLFSRRVLLCLISSCLLGAGCASNVVPTTGPHPPTEPSTVELFQDPPFRYEDLGVVRTDKPFEWQEVGEVNGVIEELRAKAAALGANGLLLQVPDTRLKATGVYNEENYQVPIERAKTRSAVATAIYVVKK